MKVEASPSSASTPTDNVTRCDETGDYLGRKGLKIGAGVGLVVLPASRVRSWQWSSSAARPEPSSANFAKHKVESGLGEKHRRRHYARVYGWHHRDLGPTPWRRPRQRRNIGRQGRRRRRQTTQGHPRRGARRHGWRLNRGTRPRTHLVPTLSAMAISPESSRAGACTMSVSLSAGFATGACRSRRYRVLRWG